MIIPATPIQATTVSKDCAATREALQRQLWEAVQFVDPQPLAGNSNVGPTSCLSTNASNALTAMLLATVGSSRSKILLHVGEGPAGSDPRAVAAEAEGSICSKQRAYEGGI
jgi:hypothetical protein